MWLGSLVCVVAAVLASAPPQEREPKLAEIKGRFVLQEGAPAKGATVKVHGWTANSEREAQFGTPEEWDDPSGVTDADGRFSISLDPPRAFQFALDVRLPGYAGAAWRWHEILPGQVVDVGEVRLMRGGTIVGRMVDAQGRPVRGPWRVYADSLVPSEGGGRDATRVAEMIDETGAFRLEDVLPGRTRLDAHSPIANWIHGPTVDVVSGETVEMNIVYTGPDNSARIVVVPFSRPFYIFRPPAQSIHLIGPDGERRTSTQIAGSSQSFAFDDLEPGSYTVEIDDPRYLPWSRADVQPGSRVQAMLKGNAAVQLLLATADGAPVDRYRLNIRYLHTSSMPNVFPILEAREPPPPGGLFDGLVPGTLVFEIEAPGHPPRDVRVDGLRAHETRVVQVELGGGVEITGVVYEADGTTPASGVTVVLKKELASLGQRGSSDADEKVIERVTTGDDARFALARVSAGVYTLVASANQYVTSARRLYMEDESAQISMTLPASATLAGRLLVPDGASFEGLELGLRPTAEARRAGIFPEEIVLAVGQDGRFDAERLPLGEVRLRLWGREVEVPRGFMSATTARPSLEVASFELSNDATAPRDFDLRDRWPGSLRVKVTKNGAPAPSMVIEGRGSTRGAEIAATTDSAGVVQLDFLPPGEWAFHVRPGEGGWIQAVPDKVEVKSAQKGELLVDIRVAGATLRVLDVATGDPIANRSIRVWPEGERSGWMSKTDADGKLELELPVGRYVVADGAGRPFAQPATTETLDWTAQGPSKDEVRISLEEEWRPERRR